MYSGRMIKYMNMTDEEKKVEDARLDGVMANWKADQAAKKEARQHFWTVAGILAFIIITAFVMV